jgi:hypothetical protein
VVVLLLGIFVLPFSPKKYTNDYTFYVEKNIIGSVIDTMAVIDILEGKSYCWHVSIPILFYNLFYTLLTHLKMIVLKKTALIIFKEKKL